MYVFKGSLITDSGSWWFLVILIVLSTAQVIRTYGLTRPLTVGS